MTVFLLGVGTGGVGTAALIALLFHLEGLSHRAHRDSPSAHGGYDQLGRCDLRYNDRVIDVEVLRRDHDAPPVEPERRADRFRETRSALGTWAVAAR